MRLRDMLRSFVRGVVRRGDERLAEGDWAGRRGNPRVARLFGPVEPDTGDDEIYSRDEDSETSA